MSLCGPTDEARRKTYIEICSEATTVTCAMSKGQGRENGVGWHLVLNKSLVTVATNAFLLYTIIRTIVPRAGIVQ